MTTSTATPATDPPTAPSQGRFWTGLFSIGDIFDDWFGFDDDGGIAGSFKKFGHGARDSLTGFGGSMNNIFGPFSLDLGVVRFGWAEKSFGVGVGIPIVPGAVYIGPDIRLVEGPNGIDTDFGGTLSVGYKIGDVGIGGSVSYMGSDWTFSINAGTGGIGGSLSYTTNGTWNVGFGPQVTRGNTVYSTGISVGFGKGGPSFGAYASVTGYRDAKDKNGNTVRDGRGRPIQVKHWGGGGSVTRNADGSISASGNEGYYPEMGTERRGADRTPTPAIRRALGHD